MNDMIVIENLTKTYQSTEAVKDASMHVKKGQIYGFLGPNGAGKTTVMKMILNLVKPTCGSIWVNGESITESSFSYLKNIGSLIEAPVFYEKLSAGRNMKLHCEYMGIHDDKRIADTMEFVGLKGSETKPVKEFSLGMKQRLGIARALISNPSLLILDEPINGLDPVGIRKIRDLLVKLRDSYGTTILISSHIISEIEMIADTVGVIKKGSILREVGMDTVQSENLQYLEFHVTNADGAALALEENFPGMNFKIISDNGIRIYQDIEPEQVSRKLMEANIGILNMNHKSSTLEDYFLTMIQEENTSDWRES